MSKQYFNELPPLEQLNVLLSFLWIIDGINERTVSDVFEYLGKTYDDCKLHDLSNTFDAKTKILVEEMLDYMKGRGHVKKIESTEYANGLETGIVDPIGHLVIYYQITFTGRLLISIGGYIEELKQKISENTRLENIENHQKTHRKWMTWLTAILASFAFLSVFLQSLEKFHVLFRIDIWAAFFLYTSGILTGIAILLIAKEVLNQK